MEKSVGHNAFIRVIIEVKYPLPSDLVVCGKLLIISMEYYGFTFPCFEMP